MLLEAISNKQTKDTVVYIFKPSIHEADGAVIAGSPGLHSQLPASRLSHVVCGLLKLLLSNQSWQNFIYRASARAGDVAPR